MSDSCHLTATAIDLRSWKPPFAQVFIICLEVSVQSSDTVTWLYKLALFVLLNHLSNTESTASI